MKRKNLFFATQFTKLLDDWLAVTSEDEDGNVKKRTQKDFADIVGIHQNMISRYKKGEAYPSDDVIKWIAEGLCVPIKTFYPSTPAELIAFDEEYRQQFNEELIDTELKIVEEAGINSGFWSFFLSIENIYDMFPFENIDDWNGVVFGRKNSKDQKVGFTQNDLMFVKKLQEACEEHTTLLIIKEIMKGR